MRKDITKISGKKLKLLPVFLVAFLAFVTGPVANVNANVSPVGSFDGGPEPPKICFYAGGWAYDPDEPGTRITVHLYFSKSPPGSNQWLIKGTIADKSRGDLPDDYAFHYNYEKDVRELLCDGQRHEVAVYGIDTEDPGFNAELIGSPKFTPLPYCGYFAEEIQGTDAPSKFDDGTYRCCTATNNCAEAGSCYTTTQTTGTIPSKGYCNSGTWQGGDAGSTQCTAIVSSGRWDLNGEAWSSPNDRCCGDDNNEYMIDETSGTDAPSGYNDGITTCCNPSTDCTYNDVCTNTGGTSSPTIPNRAYCNSGTWEGGDARSAACTAIAGATRWGIGGEDCNGGSPGDCRTQCCGDDSSEYKRTRVAGTDSTYSTSSSDDGCCSANNNCIYSSGCYNSGTTRGSIPNRNYCNAGTWEGGDARSAACTAIAGANRWNIGGEDCNGGSPGNCRTQCCGDDNNEIRINCQDGGAGACAESTDDRGCCNSANDCVYNNACYSDQEITPNGNWLCDQGTWMALGLIVTIVPDPSSVTTTWQDTDATATVDCQTASPTTSCVPSSYRVRTYTSDPGTCSTTYSGYTLPNPQTISSHVWACGTAKDDLDNEGFSDPVEFRVDKNDPTASINSLPAWTTQSSVTVEWSGSDTGGSGIDDFNIQYRITTIDGTQTQGWTGWISPSSNPGSQAFSGMVNNRTYHFRANATDNAGNTGEWSTVRSISVDLGLPACTLGSLPEYSLVPFTLTWSGSDGESGIQNYDVQSRASTSGCGMPTSWAILDGLDDTVLTNYDVAGQDGCTYDFRCNARDVAGNVGSWSPTETTTIDTTSPTTFVTPLPEWINSTSFTVSWSGSGVTCYDIQWSDNNATWNDWLTCTNSTSAVFGSSSPTTVQEGDTFYFRSRGRDAVNNESWPSVADTSTTVDITYPQFTIIAEDAFGTPLGSRADDVSEIFIKSNATDSMSGVDHHYIEYDLMTDSGSQVFSIDCGSAGPYGGVSECVVEVDFTDVMMIEFWTRVVDRAGNVNISDRINIGTYTLARFGKEKMIIAVGESDIMKVYVRNIQGATDDVTITINSTLPIDPHFVSLGNFTMFNNTWVGDDYDLKDNNRTIVVKNLNPNEFRRLDMVVWSTEPDMEFYQMFLDARSGLSASLTDNDEAFVVMTYPASFPGLDMWSILILIMLATFAYTMLGKNQKP